MSKSKEELLQTLSDYVFEMEDEEIAAVAEEYIELGYDAQDAVMDGLVAGMKRAGQMMAEEEYFVTDILMCADALNNALEVLNPHLKPNQDAASQKIKIVIGTVEGDTHDIGKNLVGIMLGTGEFEVYDLGRDVPLTQFIEKANEVNADVIGMSSLMTTTMTGMKTVIDTLKETNQRDKYKIIIGGGAVSQHYCDEIEADGYAPDAITAINLAKMLIKGEA